jgi:hypothetical protein
VVEYGYRYLLSSRITGTNAEGVHDSR